MTIKVIVLPDGDLEIDGQYVNSSNPARFYEAAGISVNREFVASDEEIDGNYRTLDLGYVGLNYHYDSDNGIRLGFCMTWLLRIFNHIPEKIYYKIL